MHPPLIDELGFVAAAKWYADGFGERSGIKVNLHFSNESQRLPHTVELPLFRILRASLSNVHRHAKSSLVDVRFAINDGEARLEVKDRGKGIDSELLGCLNKTGAGAGIGLTGMHERLRELGGHLEIESARLAPLSALWFRCRHPLLPQSRQARPEKRATCNSISRRSYPLHKVTPPITARSLYRFAVTASVACLHLT